MKNAVPRTYSGWGPVAGVIFDAIVIFVWPLVLGLRILFHRPWLIAAFPPKGEFKGAAWKVRGLGPAREAVRAIADGIRAGNRDPAPAAAEATRFRVKLRAPGLGL